VNTVSTPADSQSGKIVISHVSKEFKPGTPEAVLALSDICFAIRPQQFVAVVGRSGCGKTTLLNLIAGLLRPSGGCITIDGHPVAGPGPDRGMVFQHSALFPWLTALGNIEFGPRNNSRPAAQRRDLARELIELVRLQGCENKYPRELSGGMQQRVAIARALAMDPEIMLMDEPFGALDELTREEMQRELLRIWEARRKTVVFVTHSIREAVFLSDHIIVLSPNPGQVRKQVPVSLPRPRQRASREFIELTEEIYGAIF
jgi:ABC-type nitrate/sulfonate/bicarbonate transport system ATPase subunit